MAKMKIHIDYTANRTTRVLLGLVFALTLLFVALEWRSGGPQMFDATDADSDPTSDPELPARQQQKDMM